MNVAHHAQNRRSRHYLEDELYELVASDDSIFEFLQAGSLDGLWYWDLENPEHEWMSDRFWEVFGYDPAGKQHLASEWQDIINPDDLQVAIDNFEKHCQDPSHPYDQIVRYTHRDGSTVWVRCRGVAIRDEAGKPVRMLGAHNDVTSLIRSREALLERDKLKADVDRIEALNRDLERSNRELDDFAYVASHDLKAPLRAIENLASWIEKDVGDALPEASRRHLATLQGRVARLERLLDDLLAFARAGNTSGEREALDVGELIGEARELSALPDGFECIVGSQMPTVHGHKAPLLQVLQNLICNAVSHHDREAGHIEIHARDLGDRVAFSVADDGPGVPAEFHDKIFGLFQTLQSRDEVEGSGMGLAIVRKIVETQGGVVSIEPATGRGATFTFTWPKDARPV